MMNTYCLENEVDAFLAREEIQDELDAELAADIAFELFLDEMMAVNEGFPGEYHLGLFESEEDFHVEPEEEEFEDERPEPDYVEQCYRERERFHYDDDTDPFYESPYDSDLWGEC